MGNEIDELLNEIEKLSSEISEKKNEDTVIKVDEDYSEEVKGNSIPMAEIKKALEELKEINEETIYKVKQFSNNERVKITAKMFGGIPVFEITTEHKTKFGNKDKWVRDGNILEVQTKCPYCGEYHYITKVVCYKCTDKKRRLLVEKGEYDENTFIPVIHTVHGDMLRIKKYDKVMIAKRDWSKFVELVEEIDRAKNFMSKKVNKEKEWLLPLINKLARYLGIDPDSLTLYLSTEAKRLSSRQ